MASKLDLLMAAAMTICHIPPQHKMYSVAKVPQRKMYSVAKVPQTEEAKQAALAKAAAKRQRKQDAKSR